MPRERKVDPACIHAGNPFHECADYCEKTDPGRSDRLLGRAISGFLDHRATGSSNSRVGRARSALLVIHKATTKPHLSRSKTDLNRGRIKEEGCTSEHEKSVACDELLDCPRFVDESPNKRGAETNELIEEVPEKYEAGTGGVREISAAAEEESGKGIREHNEQWRPKAKPRISGFLVHRAPKAKLHIERSRSDLNGERVKHEGEITTEEPNDREKERRSLSKERDEEESTTKSPKPYPIKFSIRPKAKLRIERSRSDINGERVKDEGEIAVVEEPVDEEKDRGSTSKDGDEEKSTTKSPISGPIPFPIHRAPKVKLRIERSRSDLNGEEVNDEAKIAVEEEPIDEEKDRESTSKGGDEEESIPKSSKLDPIDEFPPLTPVCITDSPTVPLSKRRAAWSIINACTSRIRDYLSEDKIDDEAIAVLLSSIERSEKETGYSFEHWRSAVEKAVCDANRIAGEDLSRIRESITSDRERVLTEAQMLLNDEEIRASKADRAFRDRERALSAVAAEVEEMKRECSGLRKQLVIKERDLNCKRKELKALDGEQAFERQRLGGVREAVWRKAEIARKAGAELDTVEEDARAELDRRRRDVRESIDRLRGFEFSHRHPDFL